MQGAQYWGLTMTVDYRKDERKAREEKIFIEILSASSETANDSITLECSTKDISRSGLKIQSIYPFIVGAVLELLIGFESGGYKFLLTGEVKWFEDIGKGVYLAGFELIEAEHSDFLVWQKMFDED